MYSIVSIVLYVMFRRHCMVLYWTILYCNVLFACTSIPRQMWRSIINSAGRARGCVERGEAVLVPVLSRLPSSLERLQVGGSATTKFRVTSMACIPAKCSGAKLLLLCRRASRDVRSHRRECDHIRRRRRNLASGGTQDFWRQCCPVH